MTNNLNSLNLNIAEYCLDQKNQECPNKNALIIVDSLDSARVFTYRALYESVCCLAAGFKKLQLPRFSVVCIQAVDSYDLILSFLGALAADLVPITLLLSLSEEGVNYILKHSQARLFLQLNSTKHDFQIPKNCRSMLISDFNLLKESTFEPLHTSSLWNDPAFIFYTSGSTGTPKGVLHAHRSLIGRKPSLEYWLDLNANDIVMQTDNLCWTYSMFTGLLDPLMVGATALIYNPSNTSALAEDATSGALWLQLIQKYKITVLASTPDIYSTILNDADSKNIQIPTLRLAGSAGSLLANEVQQNWKKRFGTIIYIALGMTELSTFISTGNRIPPRQHSIGKIQPGRKVTLLPLNGGFESVPDNEEGILAIHKDELGFMLGYLGESIGRNPNYRGDWFLTQDILSRDQDGYLTYFGRVDSIVKVNGGFRVSPIQVEDVIKSCKHVKDAACGTIFNEKNKTDVLVAYVVSDQPNQQTAKLIRQHLVAHLSDYKIPQILFFVEALPFNARGKIIRSKLAELKPLMQDGQ